MDGFERMYRLHRVLRASRHPVSTTRLMADLECSKATFHRTVAQLRDGLQAPIINAPHRGYLYDRSQPEFELPGVWFSPEELETLLLLEELLARLEPGVLRDQIRPLRNQIKQVLNKGTRTGRRFPSHRFRILAVHQRKTDARTLGVVADALVRRRRLQFDYRGRAKDELSQRSVSPQRVVYYRHSWYLDGFCHVADGLRTFAADRIANPCIVQLAAQEIEDAELDAQLTHSYGIFAGEAKHVAKLLFTPSRARWVADEQWHPEQAGQFRTDGSYELHVPYSLHEELLGEILRHGGEVRVLGPKSLVEAVRAEVKKISATLT